ncbi:MAG: hypothetical protein ABEJ78_09665 [Haloferacaceae archaeon]
MSSRSRPRPPSRQPTTHPPADVRSLVVLVGWGVAVFALVWATRHPFVAGVVAASAVVAAGTIRYAASAVARPAAWELSLRVPVVDCRIDVVFTRPARGQ